MNSINVLLVEDNPADQVMVEEVLQDATTFSFHLATCERIAEVPDRITNAHPDIVLLDLTLPDSSGLVTLEKMKELVPEVPVVIFTGLDDKRVGIEAINMGAEDYLVKGEIKEGSTLERTISFALERYKLRHELYQTMDHLKRSNQKLEDFAYVISHDLKSPLNNLRSLLGMYNREAVVDDQNRQVMTMMDKSVEKLGGMLSSFTSIYLTEEGLKQAPEKVSVQECLSEVTSTLKQTIEEASGTIHADFGEAPSVIAVPILFQSILQNLITNSIKYRSHQRDPVVHISSHDTREYIVLHYRDNGIGIDMQKHKQQLFKLFKRFDVKHAEGSGVGLYMIKSIMDANGGKIEIESELDQGTSFRLYFSKVREAVPEA